MDALSRILRGRGLSQTLPTSTQDALSPNDTSTSAPQLSICDLSDTSPFTDGIIPPSNTLHSLDPPQTQVSPPTGLADRVEVNAAVYDDQPVPEGAQGSPVLPPPDGAWETTQLPVDVDEFHSNQLENYAVKHKFPERTRGPAFERARKRATITRNVDSEHRRQKYILTLAKALLYYGAPAHRIEEHLIAASDVMEVRADYVHLPGTVIATFPMTDTHSAEVYFVRADGHIALSTLHRVHLLSRKVLHDKRSAREGTIQLVNLIKSQPRYSIFWRAVFAFVCSACISPLEFGGSIVDMVVAGTLSTILKVISIRAHDVEGVQTVYEITIALCISVIARAISSTRNPYFCYNAVSSAAIIFILPGFTLLIAAMELTSENVLCGSVRMVYTIIYTLFLGFALTIGSEGYISFNAQAEKNLIDAAMSIANPRKMNATWTGGDELETLTSFGLWVVMDTAEFSHHVHEGCLRDPEWEWWRRPIPWWTVFILVPVFSAAKSLSNLQSWRSWHFPVMVGFSCITYASTVACKRYFSIRADIVSFFGAAVVGTLASIWSRIGRGTGFTSAVTGVLFLVPVALAGDNGLNPTEKSNMEESGVELAMRMIQVAVGITVGLYASQGFVYLFGARKSTGRFAF